MWLPVNQTDLMIHEKLKVSILFPWRPNLLTHILIKKHTKKLTRG